MYKSVILEECGKYEEADKVLASGESAIVDKVPSLKAIICNIGLWSLGARVVRAVMSDLVLQMPLSSSNKSSQQTFKPCTLVFQTCLIFHTNLCSMTV